MKNKKTLYVLIPLTALIWSLIIWKVVVLRPDEQSLVGYQPQIAETETADTSRYILRLNYRDPFLRSSQNVDTRTSPVSVKKANNIRTVNLKSVRSPSKPRELVYHGTITCNKQTVGLLEVGGEKKLIYKSSQVGDYQIIAVNKDTLRIVYLGKEYAYGKQ